MSVGGSAGHSGLWGLNIEEGTRQDPGGRRWDVEVTSAAEAYAERDKAEDSAAQSRKRRRQESKHDQDRETVLKVFGLFPDGDTKSALREAVGFSGNRFGPVLAGLVAEGFVEACTIVKANGQSYAGYRRTRTHSDESDSPGVRVRKNHSDALGRSECPSGEHTHSDNPL